MPVATAGGAMSTRYGRVRIGAEPSTKDAPEPQPAYVETGGVTIRESKDATIGARRQAAVDNALVRATKFGARFGRLTPSAK